MAIYKIASLNYITSGANRAFVNMDTVLDYELFRPVDILRNEDVVPQAQAGCIQSTPLSVLSTDIVTEQRVSDWHKTEFLAKEFAGASDPTSLHLSDLTEYAILSGNISAFYVQSDEPDEPDGPDMPGVYANMSASYPDVPGSEHLSGALASEFMFADAGVNNAMSREDDSEAVLLNERQRYYNEISSAHREYIRLYPPGSETSSYAAIEKFNRARRHVNRTFVLDVDLAKRSAASDFDSGINDMPDTDPAISEDRVIYPMYDMVDVHVKSAEKVSRCNLASFDADITRKREDVYLPQLASDPIEFCQVQNDAYMLTEATRLGAGMLKSSLLQQRRGGAVRQSYTVQIQSDDSRTYLYGMTRQGVPDVQGVPQTDLAGVRYNYVTEFPQSDIQAGYYQGNEYGYILRGKNSLDSRYNMNLSVAPFGAAKTSLLNCRDYAGVGQFADTLYFKFYDGVTYSGVSAEGAQSVQMADEAAGVAVPMVPYQKIECAYVNRFTTASMHKTRFFSVKLMNSELMNYEDYEDSELDEAQRKAKQLYGQIMKDIRGAVREIVENLQPAHTQFYDTMFDG